MTENLDGEHIRMIMNLELREENFTFEEGERGIIVKESPAKGHYIVDMEGRSRNYDIPREMFEVLRGYKELDFLKKYIEGQEAGLKALKGTALLLKDQLNKQYNLKSIF